MRYVHIPVLGRSCAQLTLGTSYTLPDSTQAIVNILDKYAEYGGNTLDTAPIYSCGKSQEIVGRWLAARQNRKDMIIISKGGHHFVDAHGNHHPEQSRVRPEFLAQDLQLALAKMRLDYIDLYLIHRDDPAVPVAELIDALEEYKNKGIIKAYGVSNWSTARIEAANKYAQSKGYAGIAANSPSLSLAKVNMPRWVGCIYADNDYIAWHTHTQLPLFSWAAQASGFFTGLYTRNNIPNTDIARVYYNEANWRRLARAEELARRKGKSFTANHIALAYVLNQPFPICAVIGPQKVEELASSMAATDIVLSEQELQWLNLQM